MWTSMDGSEGIGCWCGYCVGFFNRVSASLADGKSDGDARNPRRGMHGLTAMDSELLAGDGGVTRRVNDYRRSNTWI